MAESPNIILHFPVSSFFIFRAFLPLLFPLFFLPSTSLVFPYLSLPYLHTKLPFASQRGFKNLSPGPTFSPFEVIEFRFANETATTKCMLHFQSSVHLQSPVAVVYKSVRWSQQSFISKRTKPLFCFTDFNGQPPGILKGVWTLFAQHKVPYYIIIWGKMSLCFCVSNK
jgi:hypothetical protein